MVDGKAAVIAARRLPAHPTLPACGTDLVDVALRALRVSVVVPVRLTSPKSRTLATLRMPPRSHEMTLRSAHAPLDLDPQPLHASVERLAAESQLEGGTRDDAPRSRERRLDGLTLDG